MAKAIFNFNGTMNGTFEFDNFEIYSLSQQVNVEVVTGISFTLSANSCRISWVDSIFGIVNGVNNNVVTGYDVLRDGILIGSVAVGVQEYIDNNIVSGSNYFYTIITKTSLVNSTDSIENSNSINVSIPNVSEVHLLLDKDNNEHLSTTAITYSGEFDFNINMQDAVEENGQVPLFSGGSFYLLASSSNSNMTLTVGSTFNSAKPFPTLDILQRNDIRVYRDSLNDIYVQLNSDSPVLFFNDAGVITLNKVGGYSSRNFTGRIFNYGLSDGTTNEEFQLNEGSGETVTSVSTNISFNINTNISPSPSHVDSNMWKSLAPAPSTSITVINEGVGGNNTAAALARKSTWGAHGQDLTIFMLGTNDRLNVGGAILDLATSKANLKSCVQHVKTPSSDVILLTIPPFIQEYAMTKADGSPNKDYTPYYSAAEILDMNTLVVDTYNVMVAEVVSEENIMTVDVNLAYKNNGDPKTTNDSYLRNEINAGGQRDGVHPTPTGYHLGIAKIVSDYIKTLPTTYTKVVCVGDSITEGLTAGFGFDYPTKLAQELNS